MGVLLVRYQVNRMQTVGNWLIKTVWVMVIVLTSMKQPCNNFNCYSIFNIVRYENPIEYKRVLLIVSITELGFY